ncbi:MAG: hypothetical protein RL038_1049 [Actinomycetota bacterium]
MLSLWLSQIRFETISALKNSEQLLVSVIFPLGVLFFGEVTGNNSLLPLAIGVTVLGSNLAGPAIGLAFDRRYGSIKGWALTPLGVDGFLAGRFGALGLLTLIQTLVLIAANRIFGNSLEASISSLLALPLLMLGTIGIAITIASTLKVEAVLATANLALVLLSATAIWLQGLQLSFLNPLSAWLEVWNGNHLYLGVLFVYAGVFQVTARRTFKWD